MAVEAAAGAVVEGEVEVPTAEDEEAIIRTLKIKTIKVKIVRVKIIKIKVKSLYKILNLIKKVNVTLMGLQIQPVPVTGLKAGLQLTVVTPSIVAGSRSSLLVKIER